MKRFHALSILLVLLPACAGLEPLSGGDSGPTDSADGGAMLPDFEFDSNRAPGACFDGLDNNEDGTTDCADRSCRDNLASCCVGVTEMGCCQPGVPLTAPIATCEGVFADCDDASGYQVFGARGPDVRMGLDGLSFVPNGDLSADGGAVRLEALDPRRGAITIDGRIASGTAEGIDDVESIGFGLVDASRDPSELTRVEPLVGVLISRNRGRVMLQVAGERIEEHVLADAEAHRYELRVSPDGTAVLTLDGGVRLSARVPVDAPMRLAVWGRTPEGAEEPPRLLSLTVTQDRCDMPAAIVAGPVVVPAPSDPDPTWRLETRELESPHVLRFDDGSGVREWMALRADGDIHIAVEGAGGYVDAFGARVLEPLGAPWAEDGVDHPRLRFDSGQLELWFTGYDAGGRGTVAVAEWDPGAERFVEPRVIEGLTSDDGTSYEAAAPFDVGSERLAVVRVRDAMREALVVFRIPPTGPAQELETIRQPSSEELAAFDRDAVDAPAVVFAMGVYRLYYAGRRGTRWSVAVLVSDDGRFWRSPVEGAIAGPSGLGFDALGRRDPAPVVRDGGLRIFFAGSDGLRTQIGRLDGYLPD